MSPEWVIMLLGVVLVVACVLPGCFLVLRKMSLMSDAISHAGLLGIVLVFISVKQLDTVWLLVGASIMGLITVLLTEALIATKRLHSDAAIGLVFPLFFSIGVVLINKLATSVHLDSDCILFGEIAYAPFNTLTMAGLVLGPKSLWVMGFILCMNVALLGIFYKELKLATFDNGLSFIFGFKPRLMHYGLMIVTSITAVGAFESVGSILVVALMIAPPATAYLLTRRLSHMIGVSILVGIMAVFTGYGFANIMDASIAGAMATMTGVCFLCAFCFGPEHGIVPKLVRFKQQKTAFSARMLLVQLLEHETQSDQHHENTITNMICHMGWEERFSLRIATYCVRKNYIQRQGNALYLTGLGREIARESELM
ncbi:zinc ABC transporter permease [Candidatus Marinamargulisbacteria bacterium SCGC AG-414-C22]|nr:zinc ABC transporter permease [Candidatus Marinamargulisbacteria bacterium SCGC AG-414-C22]